jgi:beta-glucosidase-like glycosyl hydrolase
VPRWGRNGEGGAEDPYLMGEYAAAYTKGFQFQGGDANTTKYLTGILTLTVRCAQCAQCSGGSWIR